MESGDHLLLGTDLVKDRRRIVAAYDDAAGVTAAFNRNVLACSTASSAPTSTRSASSTSPCGTRPTSGSRCGCARPCDQSVERRAISISRSTSTTGEELLTEISAKFTPERVEAELLAADFVVDGMWGREDGEFLLTLAHPYC